MAGKEGGELWRHAVRGLFQMLIERVTQVAIGNQGLTKPQSGVGDALFNPGVLALHVALQPLTQVAPHLTQVAVKGLVVLEIGFDVLGFSGGFRVVFQVFDQLQHRPVKGLADLVGAVVAHVIQNGIDRVRHHFGALISQPLGRKNHRFARMFGLQPVDNLRGDKITRAVAL